jgi:hypothetical protein
MFVLEKAFFKNCGKQKICGKKNYFKIFVGKKKLFFCLKKVASDGSNRR